MSAQANEYLEVQVISPAARLPVRGSAEAAGYDLCASEPLVIPKGGRALVPTGLAIRSPPGTYLRIAPRSGLAVKAGIDVGAGVCDRDYTGEIKVLLYNFGAEDFVISQGDRIAQAIVERILTPEVKQVDSLSQTDRGAGGFGSTGVSS